MGYEGQVWRKISMGYGVWESYGLFPANQLGEWKIVWVIMGYLRVDCIRFGILLKPQALHEWWQEVEGTEIGQGIDNLTCRAAGKALEWWEAGGGGDGIWKLGHEFDLCLKLLSLRVLYV